MHSVLTSDQHVDVVLCQATVLMSQLAAAQLTANIESWHVAADRNNAGERHACYEQAF